MKNILITALLLMGITTFSQDKLPDTSFQMDSISQQKYAEDQRSSSFEGIITKSSSKSFTETYNSLKKALSANENISIIAELDHQKNASSVGMDMRPTKIILFGNPKLGTPLMQVDQKIGLDLPQKMLVWEDSESNVYVSYNDPAYIANRYSISGKDEVIKTIESALEKLSNIATEN